MHVLMHNAMTYAEVKTYGLQLLEEVSLQLNGKESLKVNKGQLDEEDLSELISKALKETTQIHKVVVIDEIDTFQSQEKMFMALTKSILKSATNTTIIGIANSVDLPFKKKHSAIAMRDAQFLFSPYNMEELVSIIEKKFNLNFGHIPKHLH